MSMGLALGHVVPELLGLVTLVGLIAISLSVYMITYSYRLDIKLEPMLSIFERKTPFREEKLEKTLDLKGNYDVILFCLGRYCKCKIGGISHASA